MIHGELENVIRMALDSAFKQRHESATLEHLVRALLDDPSVSSVLAGCQVDVDSLRLALDGFMNSHPVSKGEVVTQANLSFHRLIQRAIMHVRTNCGREVVCLHALLALFGERGSRALLLLQQQGVNRNDVLVAMGSRGLV